MSETNEQRLQRLTELARKVWPGTDIATGRRGKIVTVEGDSSVESAFAVHIEHPRALDALEAALCTLAMGENYVTMEVGAVREMDERAEKAEAELVDMRSKLAAIAAGWDDQASHVYADQKREPVEAQAYEHCADELNAVIGDGP